MANREACELYIEQNIQDGLESGKSPHAIGKEVSLMVAKVFDVKMKANTIEQRAHRIKKNGLTNVSKKPEPNSEKRVYREIEKDSAYLRKQTLRTWRTLKRKIEDVRVFISDNAELPAPEFVKLELLAEILTEFSTLESMIETIREDYHERKKAKN